MSWNEANILSFRRGLVSLSEMLGFCFFADLNRSYNAYSDLTKMEDYWVQTDETSWQRASIALYSLVSYLQLSKLSIVNSSQPETKNTGWNIWHFVFCFIWVIIFITGYFVVTEQYTVLLFTLLLLKIWIALKKLLISSLDLGITH